MKKILLTVLICLVMCGSAYSAKDYCKDDANIVGCWSFNGTETNSLYDESGNDNHATNSGATFTTSGQVAEAYNFDGANDTINNQSNSSVDNIWSGGGSIVAWIKMDTYGGADGRSYIISKDVSGGSGYWLLWVSNVAPPVASLLFTIDGSVSDGAWRADNELSTGTWHHVGVTYNSSSISNDPIFYVNGVAVTTDDDTNPNDISSDASLNLLLGGRSGDNNRNFDGIIDQVKVFDDILTPTEILEIYNDELLNYNQVIEDVTLTDVKLRPSSGYTDYCEDASVIACYKHDYNYDKLLDISGNDHHLTISSAPIYGSTGCKELNCYDYDSTDDVLFASDSDDFTPANLTACAWFNGDANPVSGQSEGIVAQYIGRNPANGAISERSWVLGRVEDSGNVFLTGAVSDDGDFDVTYTVTGTTNISNGELHHGCLVFDASAEVEIFLDGVSEGTASASPVSLNNSTYPLYIGLQFYSIGNATQANTSFNGKIDDVIILGRDLSVTEILDIYNNGLK